MASPKISGPVNGLIAVAERLKLRPLSLDGRDQSARPQHGLSAAEIS
jgi:hypothetical protein